MYSKEKGAGKFESVPLFIIRGLHFRCSIDIKYVIRAHTVKFAQLDQVS